MGGGDFDVTGAVLLLMDIFMNSGPPLDFHVEPEGFRYMSIKM